MGQTTDGARLASKVAQVASETMEHHAQAHEEEASARGQRHVASVMEMMEAELKDVTGEFLRKFAPDAETHPDAAHVWSWITEPTHFVELLPLILAIQPIIQGYVQSLLGPSFIDVAHFANRLDTRVGLSPQEAAGAVIRGWIPQSQGEAFAEQNGVSGNDFDWMVKTGQLPPGPETVLQGWRRGFIGAADVRKAIIESDIGSQWAAFFMQMKYEPMSPALAVQAAVQGHLSLDEAPGFFAAGGADPAHWQVAYDTAGEPPGPGEMLQLLNRGKMTEAQVTLGIQESRVKDKYIPALLELRHKIPPLRSVTSFITKGAMTHEEGIAALIADGYDAGLAAKIVAAASSSKVATQKNLAAGTVVDLYEAGLIDKATADTDLASLGYEPGESGLLIALADHKVQAKAQAHELSVVKAGYTKGNLTVAQAKAFLTNAGLPNTAQVQAISEWDFEIKARVRGLTEAQVIAAAKKEVITVDDAGARLTAMGYSDTDVGVLLGTAGLLTADTAGA